MRTVATPCCRITQAEAWLRARAAEKRDELFRDLDRAAEELAIFYAALAALDDELGTDWSERLDKIAGEVIDKRGLVETGFLP